MNIDKQLNDILLIIEKVCKHSDYSYTKAKSALKKLIIEAKVTELENLHRAGGERDYDTEIDEMIDDRINSLKEGKDI